MEMEKLPIINNNQEIISCQDTELNFQNFQELKEILKSFLLKIRKAQQEDALHFVFPNAVKELRENFFVIATQGKKPLSKFETDDAKKKANIRKVDNEAALVIPEWLCVVDIDDPNEFCQTCKVTIEDIEKIATVRTGRGYHVYIVDPEGNIPYRNLRDGWEVKGRNNSLVMLPGSRIFHEELNRNVTYEVLNPHIWEWKELPGWLKGILERFMQEKSQHETKEQAKEQKEVVETELNGKYEVDFEKLKEIVASYWTQGNRQNLAIYLTAWLKKLGIDDVTIQTFMEDLIRDTGDEELRMRIKGIQKTLKKDTEQIKGYSGLVEEIGISKEELKSCIIQKNKESTYLQPKDYPNFKVYRNFKVKFGLLWKNKAEGLQQVGPAIIIQSKIIGNDKITYEVKYNDRVFLLNDVTDLKRIEEHTGINITSEKLFKEWLNVYITTQKIPIKLLCTQTGWHKIDKKWTFLHPVRHHNHIWDEHILMKKRLAKRENTEILHALVKESLENPSILTLFFVASFAGSILSLMPFEAQPFCLLVTGPSGVGKTTLSQIAVNLWYDAVSSTFASYTTTVGMERIKYQLKDLPILFDELAVSKIETEQIVFMASIGATKIRSNKKLTINFDDLSNVLFLTSEIAEEDQFRRAGAWRRMILVPLSEKLPIDLTKALKSFGAGLDFIDWLENQEISRLEKETEIFEHLLTGLEPIWKIAKPLFASALLLIMYYQIKDYKHILEFLREILLKQVEYFTKQADIIQKFKEEFSSFVATNAHSFVGLVDDAQLNRNKILGKIEAESIFIISKIMDEFCSQHGIDTKALLKELVKRDLLKPSKTANKYRTTARIRGIPCSCYQLSLDLLELELDEIINKTTQKDEDKKA